METTEIKKHNLRDIFRMLNLEGQEILAEMEESTLVNHVKETGKMSLFWWAAMMALSVAIIAVSYLEYRPDQTVLSGSYSLAYTILVGVMVLCTFTITVATSRVGLYAAGMIMLESVALTLFDVIYRTASAITPDLIEKALDKGKVFEKMLTKAREDGNLGEVGTRLFKTHAHITAWALFAPWILLSLPLSVFAHPTLIFMSLVGVAILIYQVVGFDTEAYWYPLVQQGGMYAVASIVIFNLAVLPIVRSSGVFEGWGPAEAGYIKTAFWFVVFVLAAAIAFKGSGVTRIEEGKNKGKTTFQIGSAAQVFAAVVLIVAAFLFGNLFLTKVSGLDLGNVLPQAGNNNSGGGTANGNEINTGNGPYVKNTDPKLRQKEAYKFPNNDKVYIYEGKQLHPVADPQAYFRYYGCSGGQRVIECHTVYELPASIKPGDSILQGGEIK